MKRALVCALLALALTAPADAQRRMKRQGGLGEMSQSRRPYANPSAGIAADLELARLTGEKKGRWFALRQTAAPDAVMFVPQMVLAQTWLKDRSDPAQAIRLRPYHAWASCDGSLIVTSGARQDGAVAGWYTTVWQRQPDGVYRWVLDHNGPLAAPSAEPDMIEAKVAECPAGRPSASPSPPEGPGKRKRGKPPPIVLDPVLREGRSRDGSLTWKVTVEPSGARHFSASMRVDGGMQTFRDEKVAAAGS